LQLGQGHAAIFGRNNPFLYFTEYLMSLEGPQLIHRKGKMGLAVRWVKD